MELNTGSDYGSSMWSPEGMYGSVTGFAGYGNELASAAAAWDAAVNGAFYQNAANQMGGAVSTSGQTYTPTNTGQNAVVTSVVTWADPEFPWFIYDTNGIGDDSASDGSGVGQALVWGGGLLTSLERFSWDQFSGYLDAWLSASNEAEATAVEGMMERLAQAETYIEDTGVYWEDISSSVMDQLSGIASSGEVPGILVIVDPVAICNQPDLAQKANFCSSIGGGSVMY